MGREDRLVRACIALSLVLMGGFAVLASGGVEVAVVAFVLLALWFSATAGLGWDPAYARLGIDTVRDLSAPSPEPVGVTAGGTGPSDHDDHDAPREIDLRDREASQHSVGKAGDQV